MVDLKGEMGGPFPVISEMRGHADISLRRPDPVASHGIGIFCQVLLAVHPPTHNPSQFTLKFNGFAYSHVQLIQAGIQLLPGY